ncbi:MAG: hypothetical protein KAI75_02035, partial [Desulfobulbaceae bacterium]|nr:hypothetical protein [Desulfobulbaceae bacterium]
MLFQCKCGFSKEVSDQHKGKKAACPVCRSAVVVGETDDGREAGMTRTKESAAVFHCSVCGFHKDAPSTYLGRTGACPKCNARVTVSWRPMLQPDPRSLNREHMVDIGPDGLMSRFVRVFHSIPRTVLYVIPLCFLAAFSAYFLFNI